MYRGAGDFIRAGVPFETLRAVGAHEVGNEELAGAARLAPFDLPPVVAAAERTDPVADVASTLARATQAILSFASAPAAATTVPGVAVRVHALTATVGASPARLFRGQAT